MKSNFLVLGTIMMFFLPTALLKAQNSENKLQSVVNEQFGTLLESLLTDGKLSEANAKTYLETVFGYDEAVSGYLKTANLSEQIKSLQPGRVTADKNLGTLSKTLIGLMPEQYKSEVQKNIEVQASINGSIKEIASGKLGENSLQLIDGIIQGIKENRERVAKEKAILEKIKSITPTLNSLAVNNTSEKLAKYSVPMTKDNWVEISDPDWTKKHGRLNKVALVDNGIQMEGDWKNFDPPTYQFNKYFKNNENFDFSRDFRAEFELSVDAANNYNYFYIQLAGMYQMQLMFYKEKAFNAITPKKYYFTNKYGVFYNSMYTETSGFTYKVVQKKPCVDYSKPIKITMEKIGSKLSFRFNDCTEISYIDMDYFYNKHGLDFKAEGKITLHSMTLEHL